MEEPSEPSEKTSNDRKQPVTCYLVMSSIICFLGSPLQFGYNLSVINAPELVIKRYFRGVKNFDFLWSLAVSIFAIGGMFGAFVGPYVAKRIGRKKTLMVNNLLVILGGILLFCTKTSRSVALLCIARTIVGVNAGINTVVAPMYLLEIAPLHVRGSLGTLSQFGIVSGILLGNVLGMKAVLGNASGWPYLFGVTTIIGIIQFFLLSFCPESPRWLIAVKNNEADAVSALQKLRSSDDVSSEINEIKRDAARESTREHVSVLELFRNSYYHKPLLISVVLQLAQQLSGIGGILYYSTSLFVKVGMSESYSQIATCGVGALSVISVAIAIATVEVVGRRKLLLFGLGGMLILYIVVTVSLKYVIQEVEWAKILGVIATLGAVLVFQSGPGNIPWFIVSELFSQSSISAAVSVAGPTNWMGNFIVGLVFPHIDRGLYPYTFVPFIILLVIFFVFTFFVVPETKGRTIEEINAELHGTVITNNGSNESTPLIGE